MENSNGDDQRAGDLILTGMLDSRSNQGGLLLFRLRLGTDVLERLVADTDVGGIRDIARHLDSVRLVDAVRDFTQSTFTRFRHAFVRTVATGLRPYFAGLGLSGQIRELMVALLRPSEQVDQLVQMIYLHRDNHVRRSFVGGKFPSNEFFLHAFNHDQDDYNGIILKRWLRDDIPIYL